MSSSQQIFGLNCVVRVTGGWFVGVAEVGVGSCSCISVVGNVEIMTTSECGTITDIVIHCIRVVLVDWRFERWKVISVGEGENEGFI